MQFLYGTDVYTANSSMINFWLGVTMNKCLITRGDVRQGRFNYTVKKKCAKCPRKNGHNSVRTTEFVFQFLKSRQKLRKRKPFINRNAILEANKKALGTMPVKKINFVFILPIYQMQDR